MTEASRDIKLFGTDEPVAEPILLQAGPLSAELEDGNLRYVRFHGVEMLRAISFIVRDKNWGTYRPRIDNLRTARAGPEFYRRIRGDRRGLYAEFRVQRQDHRCGRRQSGL